MYIPWKYENPSSLTTPGHNWKPETRKQQGLSGLPQGTAVSGVASRGRTHNPPTRGKGCSQITGTLFNPRRHTLRRIMADHQGQKRLKSRGDKKKRLEVSRSRFYSENACQRVCQRLRQPKQRRQPTTVLQKEKNNFSLQTPCQRTGMSPEGIEKSRD